MSLKLVHTKLAVVSTVQTIKPNIDNAVEIANGEIRNAHRSKDGGQTGIFDSPAFVLQPTLGNWQE